MQQKRWNLMRRRECLVPTWRGWLVLLFALAMMGYAFMRGLHPFLAITDSRPGGVLVVEGWAPDYALEAAVAEFRAHPYEKLYVSGGPIEAGAPLVEYKTYAQRGAATLLELGLSSNIVQSVPAPFVRQDRTYASAVTLNRWLLEHGGTPKKLNLISVGPHARRSRLMYDKAFGKGVE